MTYAILAPHRYVRHYLRAGWKMVGPAYMHHGFWSYLMTRDDAP